MNSSIRFVHSLLADFILHRKISLLSRKHTLFRQMLCDVRDSANGHLSIQAALHAVLAWYSCFAAVLDLFLLMVQMKRLIASPLLGVSTKNFFASTIDTSTCRCGVHPIPTLPQHLRLSWRDQVLALFLAQALRMATVPPLLHRLLDTNKPCRPRHSPRVQQNYPAR